MGIFPAAKEKKGERARQQARGTFLTAGDAEFYNGPGLLSTKSRLLPRNPFASGKERPPRPDLPYFLLLSTFIFLVAVVVVACRNCRKRCLLLSITCFTGVSRAQEARKAAFTETGKGKQIQTICLSIHKFACS